MGYEVWSIIKEKKKVNKNIKVRLNNLIIGGNSMERNDKIKKIVGIIIISSIILFNAVVIFREDIKLDRIKQQLAEIKVGKEI